TDSKPVQCRFESDRGHRTPPAVMPVGFRVSGCRVGQTSGTKTGRSEGTTFVRFGFISHVVGDDGDSARVLREAVELARIAEEAGFDSFWIAEHHFGVQRAHCPSPLILAAAVAEHTERIRLGTAALVGSLHDPIRLAADAAMVDTLSGGRLELGLGAGADAETSRRFGRDHDARHELFTALLDELDELLA